MWPDVAIYTGNTITFKSKALLLSGGGMFPNRVSFMLAWAYTETLAQNKLANKTKPQRQQPEGKFNWVSVKINSFSLH